MMKQEERYNVIKNTDLDEAITPKEQVALFRLCTKILVHRRSAGKAPLRCVVVEKLI